MLFAEEGAGLVFSGSEAATSTLITFLLGIGIVFVGLIALILIIKILSGVMQAVGKRKAAAIPAPEVRTEPEPDVDRGALLAAVSAAIATVMGEQVAGIRIVSFKKAE